MKRVNSAVLVAILTGALLYLPGCDSPAKPDEGNNKKEYSLSVSASPQDGGSVGVSPATPASGKYESGTKVTLRADSADGYTFFGWDGDTSGNANPLTVTMNANKSFTAIFQPEAVTQPADTSYKLTVTRAPPEGGSVTVSPDSAAYRPNVTVSLTATPESGYEFADWSGDRTGSNSTLSVTMTKDMAVTANFRPRAVTPPVGGLDDGGPAPWEPSYSCSGATDTLDLTKDNLGLTEHYAIVKFNNGAAPEVTYSDSNMYENILTVSGEHITFKVSYYYAESDISFGIIVSGIAQNGSLRIEDENGRGYRKTLYLNGVNITNRTGPAINIQSNKRTDVHLVGSCGRRNIINGRGIDTPQGAEQAKGTLFAEGTLVFGGAGSLEARSTAKHAIVSDENIEVKGGNIIIYESAGDGIHANNKITVNGGTLQIKCVGDAIQNERKSSPVTINGGKVTIRTTGPKGHGIVSDSSDIVISDSLSRPDINITLTGNGSKAIRAHGNVTVNGGGIRLEAYGARESVSDDTSSAAGIKANGNVTITKGTLTVKAVRNSENGKGLNVDGNVIVSGGTADIAADGDGVRVRGSFTITGGTLKSLSAHKKDIDCDGAINVTGGTLEAPNRNK
ncbi:MAG: carbohydrate-binding domain-containing protein [Chitinispirillales bacterium]|jgi:uncharacterized repeat protein (TIGR02543 family)|nr:carbohydrate-binding domain-containing protein [Chitinispirillales bacterium]